MTPRRSKVLAARRHEPIAGYRRARHCEARLRRSNPDHFPRDDSRLFRGACPQAGEGARAMRHQFTFVVRTDSPVDVEIDRIAPENASVARSRRKKFGARKRNAYNTMQRQSVVRTRSPKYFTSVLQKNVIICRHPASMQRAYRDRHDTRGGMRWTRWRRARVFVRTNGAEAYVKACGPGTPTLVSSSRG
jgi:hypothetical protein